MSVLKLLLSDGALDFIDVSGRRLGEQASSCPTEIVVKRCPWSGARQGGEMNVSAWNQVQGSWSGVKHELHKAGANTAGQVYEGLCALRWRVLSLSQPIGEVQAATFKTALGLQRPLTSWLLLDSSLASKSLSEVCEVSSLMERLSDEGWLIGNTQVCAGPPKQIEEAWACLMEPSSERIEGAELGIRCANLVAGAYAILGAARALLKEGHEASGFQWQGALSPEVPEVLRVLRQNGPTALVREVPRFEPQWARHLYENTPPSVENAIVGALKASQAAQPFAALDEVWSDLVVQCGLLGNTSPQS